MKVSQFSPMLVQPSIVNCEGFSDDDVLHGGRGHKAAFFVASREISGSAGNKKTVRFNDRANIEIEAQIKILDPPYIQELWWSASALKRFREERRDLVEKNCLADKAQEQRTPALQTFLSVMHRIFEACCEVRSECDCFDDCSVIPRYDLQRFLFYIHAMDYRHGLERATSDILTNDRQARRKDLVATVLQLQAEWKHHLNKDTIDLLLRDASENITRPSRLFARQLAAAHAFMPNNNLRLLQEQMKDEDF